MRTERSELARPKRNLLEHLVVGRELDAVREPQLLERAF